MHSQLIKIAEEFNVTVYMTNQAIKELPSSLHHLVGLEELSLRWCRKLEIIPSSIGSLGKLSKLALTCCESLETFPSSIFKLKLTKLYFHGCSMPKTFPKILEPAETFVHINLTKTAIKKLSASVDYLVGLRILCLKLCSDLVSLPNSIANLNYLSEPDCSGCCSIVNLPESIANLSSLKSLDLSDCKRLECIPQLPSSLNKLLAYDYPSVRKIISNSRLELPSNSDEDNFIFHFTNSQEMDETACSNIGAEAWLRITKDAYKSVFFCFPWSAIPGWFRYRCTGRLIATKMESPDWLSNSRLVGFGLSVVLGCGDMDDAIARSGSFTYILTFEADGRIQILANYAEIKCHFFSKDGSRLVVQDHTFIWKYHLDFASIDNRLFDAHNFTFEFSKHDYLCPLPTKGIDANDNSLKLLKIKTLKSRVGAMLHNDKFFMDANKLRWAAAVHGTPCYSEIRYKVTVR